MIEIYFIRTPELIAQMQDCLASGHIEGFQVAAHNLKSNSAFVGAIRVSELSRRLEYMAKFGQWHAPEKLLAVLEKEARRSREILAEEKKREENTE
jgi:HPt (histidine-containing phosphotransfer) domain-containing protein